MQLSWFNVKHETFAEVRDVWSPAGKLDFSNIKAHQTEIITIISKTTSLSVILNVILDELTFIVFTGLQTFRLLVAENTSFVMQILQHVPT